MLNRNCLSLVALSAVSLSVFVGLLAREAMASNLAPGTYQCYSASDFLKSKPEEVARNPKFVSGFCKYQARYGDQAFRNLLSNARKVVKSWSGNREDFENNLEPTEGMGQNTVIWWFSDNDSNEALGEMLKQNDTLPKLTDLPRVEVVTTMYSFQRGYQRQFGVEVGAFYGKRELEENPGKFIGELVGGIFSSAVGIGNPLASFLELGISASLEKKRAEVVTRVSNICTVGDTCNYSHNKVFYFKHNVGVEKEQIGLQVSATPWIGEDDPTRVRLERFTLRYAVPTGEENSPVDVYMPNSGMEDLNVRADELYVIGNESTNTDVRTGKLLGFDNNDAHTQSLILMKVSVLMPEDSKTPVPRYQPKKDDRSFTQEELAQIPNGELSMEQIFDSLEPVCFSDILNPQTTEPICGFRFAKIDKKLMNHRLKFKIKKKLFAGGGFRNDDEQEKYWLLSDVYKGKGYYQLPGLDNETPGSYVLNIELDDSNKIAKAMKRSQAIKGLKFEFGYFPGSANPLQFAPEFVKKIK